MNFAVMISGNQNKINQKRNSLPHTKNTLITTTLSSSFFISCIIKKRAHTHQHTHTDENIDSKKHFCFYVNLDFQRE